MFSATMPPKIRTMAKKILNDPAEISIAISKPADKLLQLAYVVYENQKTPLLRKLLASQTIRSGVIFCSTKKATRDLARELKKDGIEVEAIHSDLEQPVRESLLRDFKSQRLKLLVATDILSRGIDIDTIDLVINYDVPQDGEDYVHRSGRTARAERGGVAITLINPNDQFRFGKIEDLIGATIHKAKIPNELGDGPEYNPKKRSSGGFRGGGRHRGKGGHQKRKPRR